MSNKQQLAKFEQEVKTQGLKSGFYRFNKRNYYVIEFKDGLYNSFGLPMVRAYAIFKDGSDVGGGFQEDSLYKFEDSKRKGIVKEITKKQAFKKKVSPFELKLDLENYDQNELESIQKQFKLKDKSEVIKFLIVKGIYAVRDMND